MGEKYIAFLSRKVSKVLLSFFLLLMFVFGFWVLINAACLFGLVINVFLLLLSCAVILFPIWVFVLLADCNDLVCFADTGLWFLGQFS